MSQSGADAAARRRALLDHDATLLVEAGAGTGKTSLLAGRVCLLMAQGVPPREIAAITFTEAAAGELGERVRGYLDALLRGETPEPLKAVLPAGVTPQQAGALAAAAATFDALTVTTIHGFCQALIRDYAIEADLDPGATLLDRDAQPIVFDQVFEGWLTGRLSAEAPSDDVIAALCRQSPRDFHRRLRALATLREKHRSARPPEVDLAARPDLEFIDAAQDFLDAARPDQANAAGRQWREDIERLIAFFQGALDEPAGFERLWALAHPPELRSMRKKTRDLARPRDAAALGRLFGLSEAAGVARLSAAFDRLEAAYRTLLGVLSAQLMRQLSQSLDGMLQAYRDHKRAAAQIDFSDLLERAHRLLRDHPQVRDALAGRYPRVLVDEFQDTDPLQCDILFRLAADRPVEDWRRACVRPGALFLVGDPKQSLYRFRGADVGAYQFARGLIERQPGAAVLAVSRNFRSAEAILEHVNHCFEAPLNAPQQPGYVALDASRTVARHELPCVAKLTVPANPLDGVSDLREAEAACVADACARLIGALRLRTGASERPLSAGDIALLAPTSWELWRYERALRDRGLPFAAEAGKSLFSRQEAQDVVALVRALADPADTLAFGALLRGPLIGLTDEALLDVAAQLPPEEDGRRAALTIRTPPDLVTDPLLRRRLQDLQHLRRRASLTTPAMLLAEAVERLSVRATLALRDPRTAAAAEANLDALLTRAGRYGVRGLRRLAHDLQAGWAEGVDAAEGQPEAGRDAIEIVTIHSAKGREWPVVIPINAMGGGRRPDDMLHNPADDTLHWRLGDVASPDLAAAMTAEREARAREGARLLYVACTRAEDLLIVPHVAAAQPGAYSRAVDLAFQRLPELPLRNLPGGSPPSMRDAPTAADGAQDPETFAAERARLAEVAAPILWRTPSAHDGDRRGVAEVVEETLYELEEAPEPLEGGRIRGLILHKLMEEVLGEDLADTTPALSARASELFAQLAHEPDAAQLDPSELAATVLSTLALPEVAELRSRLVPEPPVYGMVAGDTPSGDPLAGRADAIAFADGRPEVVVDWKSDLTPSDHQIQAHVDQVRLYLAATGARRGLIVYMSLGVVRGVRLAPQFAPRA